VKKLFLLFIFFSLASYHLLAQSGGDGVYKFIDMPNSARVAALGGNFLTINDDDLSVALTNPSLITEAMHNRLGLSFVDYYTDISYGYAQYGRTFNKAGTFIGTMQFINYGTFTEADATGQRYGEFSAGEYALNIGWGRWLTPKWSVGANFKLIYSSLESYNSFGTAVDVAGSYYSEEGKFTASLIARNIGVQITPYGNNAREPVPFELQAGLSKGLKHLPLTFSALFTNLQRWDLRYDNPDDPSGGTDPITGESQEVSGIEKFADNFMRHLVLGAELKIAKVLSLRASYNYLRRQEMKVPTKTSTVGFSWGFGIRISKFHISYARSAYHLVGSPNFFTFTFDLDEFGKNKKSE
jgi:hypothetical protein